MLWVGTHGGVEYKESVAASFILKASLYVLPVTLLSGVSVMDLCLPVLPPASFPLCVSAEFLAFWF